MGKSLYIAEKPSVAQEFAKALGLRTRRGDGFLESEEAVITWCVGHLVTMSYPDKYDGSWKRWNLEALPFLPETFKYEVIDNVKKQFGIVAGLLNREDVETIYVCTDSGREGEYIYRLVEQEALKSPKKRKRVWIDSQTEEEILRGIKEAKPLESYDNLGASAYLRAKEDYLMGINFSRLMTLKYGNGIARFLKKDRCVIAVGRVMTCVLGMVVRREREIREFEVTNFYRVIATFGEEKSYEGEWRAVAGSTYFESPLLYNDNGFLKEEEAQAFIRQMKDLGQDGEIAEIKKTKERKKAPLLFNLAELQNECSKRFKISPDETLRLTQELYEKKLLTYPRTDARVLSTAVAKEISKNLNGLMNYEPAVPFLNDIKESKSHQGLAKTKYVDDKKITDHYAIIPTGQGLGALKSVSDLGRRLYDMVVRRFLSIFYPDAVYTKVAITTKLGEESFFANFKVLSAEGYLKVVGVPGNKEEEEISDNLEFFNYVQTLKKGMRLPLKNMVTKEGKTSPPKRYNSGSLILAMENAGKLIEDEELRAQIHGSGIGTSATRGEILKKLFSIDYLKLNKKTQIVTPTMMGEMIFDAMDKSLPSMLNPELTASWEKGLTQVAEGEITEEVYMEKLNGYISRRTNSVRTLNNQGVLLERYRQIATIYHKGEK
ncbi:DNA topoisomerase-3 [Lachnospiraceae bacterium PF1-21]